MDRVYPLHSMKIVFQITFIVFTFLSADAQSKSQSDLFFNYLSTESGLSESFVHCIHQDSHGFMWFGTNTGLNRYDGSDIMVFRHSLHDSSSISSNFISSIYEDRERNLWIGTSDGVLNLYDRYRETFIRHKIEGTDRSLLDYEASNFIYETVDGRLWVGSQFGLYVFDRKKRKFVSSLQFESVRDSLGVSEITAISEDRDGCLWLGTLNRGIVVINVAEGTFIHHHSRDTNPNSLSGDRVEAFVRDRTGRLWIAIYGGGINLYNETEENFIRIQHDPYRKNSLSDDFVFCLLCDSKGTVWAGTEEGGLNRADPFSRFTDMKDISFTHYRHQKDNRHSLSSDNIRSIFEDHQGNLWVGTFRAGINFYLKNRKQFRHFISEPYNPNSLSDNVIFSIFEDSRNNFWICTNGGGLNLYNRQTGSFSSYKQRKDDLHSLSDDRVTSICEDSEG